MSNSWKAAEFLQQIVRDDRVTLVSIPAEGGGPKVQTFTTSNVDGMAKWIEARDGKSNLYFQVNPLKDDVQNRKAKKTDIKHVVQLHIDIDDLDGLERLEAFAVPPTAVVCSGNGYHAYWQLSEPLSDLQLAERINIRLVELLGGDTAHNADRILRVPFTTNLPNQKKRSEGKVRVQSNVVDECTDFTRRYSIADFDHLLDEEQQSDSTGDSKSVDVQNSGQPVPLDEDSVPVSLSAETKEIILTGGRIGAGGYRSRSEALHRVNCDMVRAGIPVSEIVKVITNPKFAISESVLEKQEPQKYAERQVRHASDDVAKSKNDSNQYGSLRDHILEAKKLLELETPPIEYIIPQFMPTHSLSMVYAERGLGKTWFALTLALSVARGDKFLEYMTAKARAVLYIDGEMALSELQERVKALDPDPPSSFTLLPSEVLYQVDRPLNLHEEADQKRVLQALDIMKSEGCAPELIVVDNLSSLARGVDENSNSELDGLLTFLIQLRHHGFSVLLVHHAGKNKQQRGASRREDFLNLSIELRNPKDEKKADSVLSQPHDGAHFIMRFSKVRGRRPKPEMLDLKLKELPNGRVEWLIDNAPQATAADRVLRCLATDNPKNRKAIAEALNVSAGRITQLVKELADAGLVENRRGEMPLLMEAGRERLLDLWPELSDVVQVQIAASF